MQVNRVFFLFFLVFGLWQAAYFLIYVYSPSGEVQRFIELTIQITYLCISLLLIKRETVVLRQYGLCWPQSFGEYTAIGILFAFIYVIMILFIPGSFAGFEVFPRTLSSSIPLEFLSALFTAIASESVFRGYMYGKLKEVFGPFPALCASSVMFSLHRVPLPFFFPYNSSFENVISLFALGIFLGYFLQRTRNLVCPITTYVVILLLYRLTPLRAAVTEQTKLFSETVAAIVLIVLLRHLIAKNRNVFVQ